MNTSPITSWSDIDTNIFTTIDTPQIQAMIPPVLYKYRTWGDPDKAYIENILREQIIYFSRPIEDFEDEYDCRYPVNFDFSQETFVNRYINYNKRASNLSYNQWASVARFKYKELLGTPELQQKYKDNFYKQFNQTKGVFCFCQNNVSIDMWNGYSADFSGYCVGIDMRPSASQFKSDLIAFGEIRYVPDGFPGLEYTWIDNGVTVTQDDIAKFYMRLLTTKYHNWRHEDEFRFMKFVFGDIDRVMSVDERKFKILATSYREIIFGYQMPSKSIDEIKQICINQGLNVTFMVAFPNPDRTVRIEPMP